MTHWTGTCASAPTACTMAAARSEASARNHSRASEPCPLSDRGMASLLGRERGRVVAAQDHAPTQLLVPRLRVRVPEKAGSWSQRQWMHTQACDCTALRSGRVWRYGSCTCLYNSAEPEPRERTWNVVGGAGSVRIKTVCLSVNCKAVECGRARQGAGGSPLVSHIVNIRSH